MVIPSGVPWAVTFSTLAGGNRPCVSCSMSFLWAFSMVHFLSLAHKHVLITFQVKTWREPTTDLWLLSLCNVLLSDTLLCEHTPWPPANISSTQVDLQARPASFSFGYAWKHPWSDNLGKFGAASLLSTSQGFLFFLVSFPILESIVSYVLLAFLYMIYF